MRIVQVACSDNIHCSRKSIGAKLVFKVGEDALPGFRMIERHYFKDQLIKSFDFTLGFCMSVCDMSSRYRIQPHDFTGQTPLTNGRSCIPCRPQQRTLETPCELLPCSRRSPSTSVSFCDSLRVSPRIDNPFDTRSNADALLPFFLLSCFYRRYLLFRKRSSDHVSIQCLLTSFLVVGQFDCRPR